MYPSPKVAKKGTRKGDDVMWTVLKMAELPVKKEIQDEECEGVRNHYLFLQKHLFLRRRHIEGRSKPKGRVAKVLL